MVQAHSIQSITILKLGIRYCITSYHKQQKHPKITISLSLPWQFLPQAANFHSLLYILFANETNKRIYSLDNTCTTDAAIGRCTE